MWCWPREFESSQGGLLHRIEPSRVRRLTQGPYLQFAIRE